MMSQDNRLLPVSPVERALDRPLSEIPQTNPLRWRDPRRADAQREYLNGVIKSKFSFHLVCRNYAVRSDYRLPRSRGGNAFHRAEARSGLQPAKRSSSTPAAQRTLPTSTQLRWWKTRRWSSGIKTSTCKNPSFLAGRHRTASPSCAASSRSTKKSQAVRNYHGDVQSS